MAASMEKTTTVVSTEKADMAVGGQTINNEAKSNEGKDTKAASLHLLYPEKFAECYQEEKLKIINKKKSVPPEDASRKTFNVPESSVLSKIKDFLPKLSSANEAMASKLLTEPAMADRLDIENLGDAEERHIEMNLSLIPPELISEADFNDTDSDEEGFSSGSDCESVDGGDGQKCMLLNSTEQPEFDLKLSRDVGKRQHRPKIEELSSDGGCEKPVTDRSR